MYKFMRVVVLFDLPTSTRSERRDASKFRLSLLNDGFDMLQYSIYSRLCPNRDSAEKHMLRTKRIAPPKGSIRILYVTEHQFSNMYIIAGEKTSQERLRPTKQLTFF